MLATFTTKEGLLVIRSEDLRRIQDRADGHPCIAAWIEGDEVLTMSILGTAQENLDRIVTAEAQQFAAYAEMQARSQQGLPALPIARGGKVAR